VGNWPHAVAGIAFGGFVPMAHDTLVNAVQFTVLGSFDTEEEIQEKIQDEIEILITKLHEGVHDTFPGHFLFGKWQQLLSEGMSNHMNM
jgi:hypothetical protein